MEKLVKLILSIAMTLVMTVTDSTYKTQETDRVQEMVESMTLHEKACQMMISYQYTLPGNVSATETGRPLKQALEKYPVAGILYDTASMKSHEQLKDLVKTADSYSDIPMFFCVDEEGGRVARIGNTIGYEGYEILDPMLSYSEQGTETAYENARFLAGNIASYGFNLDFAPVADVYSNPENSVIWDRAYSKDFDRAAKLIPAAVKGFHDGNIACTLKHFPGHGDTSGDTHAGSVVLKKTVDELKGQELKPFRAGIDAGADCVMLAHIIVEEIGEPTLFSEYLVTDVLRGEMGFGGVVITDGLGMKAITDEYSTEYIMVNGIKAGVDLFLCPMDLDAAVQAVENAVESGEIPEERIDESVYRILTLKDKRGILD